MSQNDVYVSTFNRLEYALHNAKIIITRTVLFIRKNWCRQLPLLLFCSFLVIQISTFPNYKNIPSDSFGAIVALYRNIFLVDKR